MFVRVFVAECEQMSMSAQVYILVSDVWQEGIVRSLTHSLINQYRVIHGVTHSLTYQSIPRNSWWEGSVCILLERVREELGCHYQRN